MSGISASVVTDALRELRVARDGMLLVHAGLQGSGRIEGPRSRDKLDTIVAGLRGAVPDGVLAMPTFTYSACWGQAYDRDRTPSTVGQLGEHFRLQPGVRRTSDPIFSTAVLGDVGAAWEEPLFAVGDTECFGPQSVFSFLHERAGTLLFWDVGFGFCTHVHRVESVLRVGYRFLKPFTGVVRDEGREVAVTARFFCRRLDLHHPADPHFGPLEERLLASGGARRLQLPGGPLLLAVDARAIAEEAARGVAQNPLFLVREGHGLPALEEAA